MRTDTARASTLAEAFAELRLPGSPGQARAFGRMAEEWRAAGLQVTESVRPTQLAPESSNAFDLWPAALLALALGIVLEWRLLAGLGSPSPFVLAGLFGVVLLTAVVSRRLRTGRWLPYQAGLVDLAAYDPASASPPPAAILWIVTRGDTPAPGSAWRIAGLAGRLDWVWLALLVLPGFYFGTRDWLARSAPALMVGLAGLAVLRRVDPWTREPYPYPADNRTGLALAVELARSLTPALRGRLDLRWAVLAAPADSLIGLAGPATGGRSSDPRAGAGRALIVLLDAPGVGSALEPAGSGPGLELGLTVARDLWLPVRPRDGRAPAVAPADAKNWVALCGSSDPGAAIDPALLGAAAQWVGELALRFARQGGPEPRRDPASPSTVRAD